MKKTTIYPLFFLLLLLFSCTKEEEKPIEKECTNPNFGEMVSSMHGFKDGVGFIDIGKVWGSYGKLNYEWAHGARGSRLDGLSPGIYTVTITDSENCSVVKEYDLTLEDTGLQIGDEGSAGGIVFFIDNNGNGLEAAPAYTIFSNKEWGCEGTEISTLQGVGSGQSNTDKIIAECPESGIAAILCKNLNVNAFNDWYLPSSNELNLLSGAIYSENITGFPQGNFWSSSEAFSAMAYVENLAMGGGSRLNKSTGAHVIAIRSFSE